MLWGRGNDKCTAVVKASFVKRGGGEGLITIS
uniref:Uncharacterized protein n=1 Tax=Anguilla anguilla TaxID=7936 RepID=A0A0E9WMF9_ANGAN